MFVKNKKLQQTLRDISYNKTHPLINFVNSELSFYHMNEN